MGKITALEKYNSRMPEEIWRWRDALISEHAPVMRDLIASYADDCRQGGYAAANNNLRAVTEKLQAPALSPLGLELSGTQSATVDDYEIKEMAERCANWCADTVNDTKDHGGDIAAISYQCEQFCVEAGVRWPMPDPIPKTWTAEKIQSELLKALARCQCARWWRRKLRPRFARQVEQVLRGLGCVQRRRQPYVSDWAFDRWKAAQKRNRETLQGLEAVSVQDGAEVAVNLGDAVETSMANPKNREVELYVRMRGYQEIADELQMPRLFLTLTAPSKYHSRHHYGPKNAKYNGASPAQVQEYLSGVWANIRARWAKHGIKPFGFRVVEPHHDGTPHWHMMLFFAASDCDRAWQIFRQEGLSEDAEEVEGKEGVRVDCKRLEVGESAVGYLAKYIAKNITGENLGEVGDLEGNVEAKMGAARVRAWSSLWGIRQFQQIGAVSVTVWRELRRVSEIDQGLAFAGDVEQMEAIRAACDAGDWRTFVELMGGPQVRREDQPVRPKKIEADKPGTYGEIVERIRGVVMRGASEYIKTRIHEWTIRRVAVGGQAPPSGGAIAPAQPGHSEYCQ